MFIAKALLYVFILIALFFGIKSRKFNSPFFKVLLIQTFIYSLFLIWFPVLKAYNTFVGRVNHNIIYANLNLALETLLLFFAAWQIMRSKIEKRFIAILFSIFALVFTIHLIKFGPHIFYDMADVTACITLTCLYSVVLYRFIGLNKNKWFNSAEILVSVGILLYFAASVPFVAMRNYLGENAPNLYKILFYTINYGLANLRYLLLAISFIIIYRSNGKSQLII